jgi:hypothetical protein
MKRLSILIALAISLLLPACTPASPVGTVALPDDYEDSYNELWGLYGLPYVVTYTDKTGEMPIDEVAEEMVGLLIEHLKIPDPTRLFTVTEGRVDKLFILHKDEFMAAWEEIPISPVYPPSHAGNEYWVLSGTVFLQWQGELGVYGSCEGEERVGLFTNGINKENNTYTMFFWADAAEQGEFLFLNNVIEFTDDTGRMSIEDVAVTMVGMLIEELKIPTPLHSYMILDYYIDPDRLILTSKAEIEAREGISKPIPEAGDEYWGVTCPVYLKWDGTFGLLQNYIDAFGKWDDGAYVTPEGTTLFGSTVYAYGINKVGNTYTMSQWPALVI